MRQLAMRSAIGKQINAECCCSPAFPTLWDETLNKTFLETALQADPEAYLLGDPKSSQVDNAD